MPLGALTLAVRATQQSENNKTRREVYGRRTLDSGAAPPPPPMGVIKRQCDMIATALWLSHGVIYAWRSRHWSARHKDMPHEGRAPLPLPQPSAPPSAVRHPQSVRTVALARPWAPTPLGLWCDPLCPCLRHAPCPDVAPLHCLCGCLIFFLMRLLMGQSLTALGCPRTRPDTGRVLCRI